VLVGGANDGHATARRPGDGSGRDHRRQCLRLGIQTGAQPFARSVPDCSGRFVRPRSYIAPLGTTGRGRSQPRQPPLAHVTCGSLPKLMMLCRPPCTHGVPTGSDATGSLQTSQILDLRERLDRTRLDGSDEPTDQKALTSDLLPNVDRR
jgi:hypothetical protein